MVDSTLLVSGEVKDSSSCSATRKPKPRVRARLRHVWGFTSSRSMTTSCTVLFLICCCLGKRKYVCLFLLEVVDTTLCWKLTQWSQPRPHFSFFLPRGLFPFPGVGRGNFRMFHAQFWEGCQRVIVIQNPAWQETWFRKIIGLWRNVGPWASGVQLMA